MRIGLFYKEKNNENAAFLKEQLEKNDFILDNVNPDVVISTGCAGGASTDLEVKQVVVSTASCYHDVR